MLEASHFVGSLEQQGYDKIRKALVGSVLEKTLLELGIYYKVNDELKKRYHCRLDDCYERPEYLSVILKDVYGNHYKTMIKPIYKQLEEFSYHEQIAIFLQIINQ